MPSRKKLPPVDEAPATAAEPEAPTLEWMQECREWGVRAPVGPHGLTMRAINIGIYGEIPDEWDEMTRMPRGAYPVEGVPRIDLYSLTKKSEVWAENTPELYEEAIQRRWDAQHDIPWDTLEPQSPDMTFAMSQVCTELCQQAITEAEAIGNWLHKMCYGYHEVKDFLAAEAFDAARHIEAFRRRALANSGTMGLESPGLVNRRIIEVRGGWTETALFLYLVRGSLTLLLYRYGERYACNPADATLFRLAMQDKARHLAYGMAHLKYAIAQKGSGYALGLQRLLVGAEQDLHKEMQDPVLWEALAIIFGGGLQYMAAGMDVVRHLQQQYLEDYLRRLQWVGITRTADDLAPGLSEYLTPVTP